MFFNLYSFANNLEKINLFNRRSRNLLYFDVKEKMPWNISIFIRKTAPGVPLPTGQIGLIREEKDKISRKAVLYTLEDGRIPWFTHS